MSKEKTKTFQCNILDYLEAHNNKTYKEARLALKELCLGGALKARKGQGVTFIVPAESVMADVMAKIYSDKESDIDFAVKTMQAHILNDEYTKVEELKSGDVSNRLNQKVVFDSASGGVAKIAEIIQVKVDTAFKMIPGRTGLSVMVATGKSMPLDGEAAPRRERSAMPRPPRPTTGRGEFNRNAFTKKVEEKYTQSKNIACYLHAVVAIMKHLSKDKDSNDYKRALVSLDPSPITSFYLLIEASETKDENKLLTDAAIEGLNSTECDMNDSDAFGAYKKFLEEGYSYIDESFVNEIPDIRWNIFTGGISKQGLATNISKAYSNYKLYNNDVLKSLFTKEFKEWQDYARFRINCIFSHFESGGSDINNVITTVRSVLTGDEKYSTKQWGAIVSQDDLIMGPLAFVYSGSFMYYPHVDTIKTYEDDDDIPEGAKKAAELGTGQLPSM